MTALGILGGTFNPPHLGHVICACEAREQLGLERVVLMPVAQPPHKESDGDPGAEARVRLCELAVAGFEGLEVSGLEVERGGASFTVDTLRELHGRAPEQELSFIVGGDMAESLPSWQEPEAVLQLARLAVAERAGARREDIASRLAPLDPGGRIVFFDMPRIDISSSDIRARAREGRGFRHLLAPAVAEEIARRGYYASAAGRPAA